jgi:hypothetical protein
VDDQLVPAASQTRGLRCWFPASFELNFAWLRFGRFAIAGSSCQLSFKDDFIFGIAEETERGKRKDNPSKKATIKRGLNTIKAAFRHAVETYPNLKSRLPQKSKDSC